VPGRGHLNPKPTVVGHALSPVMAATRAVRRSSGLRLTGDAGPAANYRYYDEAMPAAPATKPDAVAKKVLAVDTHPGGGAAARRQGRDSIPASAAHRVPMPTLRRRVVTS